MLYNAFIMVHLYTSCLSFGRVHVAQTSIANAYLHDKKLDPHVPVWSCAVAAKLQAMADLRKSLILPHGSQFIAPRGSQESFHSSHSHQSDPMSLPPPGAQAQMPSELPPQQTSTTENGLGPVLHDVDDYLGRPDNHHLLSTSTSRAPKPKTQSPAQHPVAAPSKAKPTATIVPVQVGAPKSSASVSRLNTICQQKGLLLDWDIKEAASSLPGFTGTLTVGAETLVLEVAQPSKKDAKQILAERGVEVAERMEARVRGGSEGGEGGSGGNENWYGKLLGMYLVVCYGSSIVHPLHLYFSLRSKPRILVFPPSLLPSFLPRFPTLLPPSLPHPTPSLQPFRPPTLPPLPPISPSFRILCQRHLPRRQPLLHRIHRQHDQLRLRA